MATPLRLPSHADIHEFSVMFTKSVKKKAKDWHDGYLKWHTFNFRAILYDDQRKPVSNEFFPNRIIHSDSELEFSNAIVQIGDQLETLQANLEHIYRSTNSPDTSLSIRHASHVTQTSTPSTPGQARIAQNRVYPPTSTKKRPALKSILGNEAMTSLSQKTPVPTRIRKLGIARTLDTMDAHEKHVTYPSIRSHFIALEKNQRIAETGWLAREDQSQSQHLLSNSPSKRSKIVRSVERSRKAAVSIPQSTKNTQPPAFAAQPQSTSVNVVEEVSIGTSKLPAPLDSLEAPPDVVAEVVSSQADLSGSTRSCSKLDPTRTETRPKPRRLLAASIRRAPTREASVDVAVQPFAVQQRCTSTLLLDEDDCQKDMAIFPCQEAVLDIESARWISAEPIKNVLDLRDSSSVTDGRLLDEVIQDETFPRGIGHTTQGDEAKTDHDPGDIEAEAAQDSTFRSPSFDNEVSMTAESRNDWTLSKLVKSPILDEDGFLCVREAPFRLGLKPHCLKSKVHANQPRSRPRQAFSLLDAYPRDGLEPAELEESSQLSQETVLFPSGYVASQEMPIADVGPGLLTQVATRAAQDIASHSTVGRLGPVRKRKAKPLPRLHKKVGPPSEARTRTLVNKTQDNLATMEPKVLVPSKQHKKQMAADSLDRTTLLHSNQLEGDHFLPPTPVTLETSELDAIFASEENRVSACAALPPENSTRKRNTSLSQAADRASAEYIVATQINTRAPDFMSAKSFQLGAKLQLDRPIAAVGMSARELAAMEMSTQLSDNFAD